MVRRSLVLKTALYAAIVFVLAVPPATLVARRIVESGRTEELRGILGPQLGFIKRQVEARMPSGEPDARHLEELGAAFHGRLAFVGWGDAGVPSALAEEPWLVDAERRHGRHTHWIRLDHRGTPVGALRMDSTHRRRPPPWFKPWGGPWPQQEDGAGARPRHPPGGPFAPQMVWLWVLLLLLAIVPPLYVWVLRPLRAMVAVARRLGSGDLQTPVPLVHADEFGELERAFERLRVELRRSLEARERLLTDVSHEIRGPLSRMMLALPMLDRDPPGGPVKAILASEIQAVDRLVGEVLGLARAGWSEALVTEPVALDQVLETLVAQRRLVLAKRGLSLATDLAPLQVSGDARLLCRAVGNLLDNAIKYGQDPIGLACGTDDLGPFVRVVDAGPGIAQDHLKNVFEPFYRPDDSRSRETGGTGLGLSIVRRIAEAHGGTVTLVCPPGGGTVAELRLPAAGTATPQAASAPASPGSS